MFEARLTTAESTSRYFALGSFTCEPTRYLRHVGIGNGIMAETDRTEDNAA
jgi:hypothetical protein